MDSPGEILRLCRLCLVKDQVNIPIFDEQGDTRQIFLKISSCLPVKVSREDRLPKKICDGCSEKLNSFYEFWSSSANAEKTLLFWVGQEEEEEKKEPTIPKPIAALVKEESEVGEETHVESIEESTKDEAEAPPAKRARRSAAVKAQINITPESEDDDLDNAEPMTKLEDESAESDSEDKDPSYTDIPGTSADDEQAGPSGMGKDGVEAPPSNVDSLFIDEQLELDVATDDAPIEQYECGICSSVFSTKTEFIRKHLNVYAKKLTCCKCTKTFSEADDLYDHHEVHKLDYDLLYQDQQSSEGEELIVMKAGQHLVEVRQPDGTDMVYIMDESDQNLDDVFLEEEIETEEEGEGQVTKIGTPQKKWKPEQLVNIEHGYVLSKSATKRSYTSPKPRATPLRRRHQVPDFSAAEYIVMEPNEELNDVHYKCQRCEQLFINKFGFFRHIEKGKCYVNGCDVCSCSFPSNSAFRAHYLVEHPDRAICHFCFRTFMYEKNVKEHVMRHLDQFRHKCDQCNKGFFTVREYRNHYRNRHMGVRHTCEVCGRSFADEYYFRKHRETHQRVNNSSGTVRLIEVTAVDE